MDKQKIDDRIDRAAEEARETMDLFAGKLDQATQCATDAGTRAENKLKEGVLRATGKVKQSATAAAGRVGEKARK